MQYEKENVKGSAKWKKSRRQGERFSHRRELLKTGNRLRFMMPWSTLHNHHAATTSVRCIEIFRRISKSCYYTFVHLNATLARTVVPAWRFKDTRVVVAHIRNVMSRHRIGIWRTHNLVRWDVFTWDKLESSRILASMVTWLAWILATASAAANRNPSIVLRSGCSSLGIDTRENFTNHSRITFTTRTIPDDLCRIIDHREIDHREYTRRESTRHWSRSRGRSGTSQAGSSSRTDTVIEQEKMIIHARQLRD